MQMKTERGLISVKEIAESPEKAKELGYDYNFHSTELKAKCFSRFKGENYNSREFCIVMDQEV